MMNEVLTKEELIKIFKEILGSKSGSTQMCFDVFDKYKGRTYEERRQIYNDCLKTLLSFYKLLFETDWINNLSEAELVEIITELNDMDSTDINSINYFIRKIEIDNAKREICII